MAIDREKARAVLDETFAALEASLLQGNAAPPADDDLLLCCEVVFASKSQAFREALLGCALARTQDRSIDIRLPYVDQGPASISLRTFDENVINPFLQEKRIPATRGPYLSMFRRGYQFTEDYKAKVKDPKCNRAFLDCIARLESLSDSEEIMNFLRFLLYCFWTLREKATVPLTRIKRLALTQHDSLLTGLLSIPSGGRIPVLLVLATFQTLKQFFSLPWIIECQGINVADAASGAGGDITIKSGTEILMAVEVTERIVDRARLVSTFNTKIAPAGILDYLFFTRSAAPDPEAAKLASQYFAQGHEIGFVEIKNWIIMVLSTIGSKGRELFIAETIRQLDKPEIPKAVKVAWNDRISGIVT